MNSLEIKNLADKLEYYNQWRRDPATGREDRLKMPNPKELGKTIDKVIKILRELENN